MTPAIKCLILLAVVALLFVTEMIPLAMTAVLAAIACSALGLVPENQIFLGLADSTVVLFGGMFVVGAAMFYTGLAQKVGGAVVKLFGTNENSLMFGLMIIAAVMSAFLSNTGTTGMPELQFGFFEYAYIGIPITVAGIVYMMFLGKYILPEAKTDEVADVEQEIDATNTTPKKQMICGIIMVGVIGSMATSVVPLELAAVVGAVLCVLTGCITEKQAYNSIDWITIFLFAGMIPVATAMNTSGAGKLIAEFTVSLMGGNPSPYLVTAVLFGLAVVLTQFMSNTASKALLCPVGIALSTQMGASPKAVLMAILIASSCAFASPVGTPPNTLVLGPGKYKFMDYVKCGGGLVAVSMIVAIIVIPIVWPFFPTAA